MTLAHACRIISTATCTLLDLASYVHLPYDWLGIITQSRLPSAIIQHWADIRGKPACMSELWPNTGETYSKFAVPMHVHMCSNMSLLWGRKQYKSERAYNLARSVGGDKGPLLLAAAPTRGVWGHASPENLRFWVLWDAFRGIFGTILSGLFLCKYLFRQLLMLRIFWL